MPELPEVETMRRGIAGIVGSRIDHVRRPTSPLRPIPLRPRLTDFRRRVTGRHVVAVGRAGKRLVVELDSGDRVVFEPRMTGRVLLAEPADPQHVRLAFDLSGGPSRQLLFFSVRGLGGVFLHSSRQFARAVGPNHLGPDALEITADQLHERLESSRRAIKVALLDQRIVAGIGNLYASEILHHAGLHPEVACNRLRPAEWERLHASIREVLDEAIRHQGSTLSDGTYRNAQNEAGGYQHRHQVYQRVGELCRRCGRGRIIRIVQAQRSTFLCPRCQPRRRRR
jgi:formamidopyrimidine-DNA glycosylase